MRAQTNGASDVRIKPQTIPAPRASRSRSHPPAPETQRATSASVGTCAPGLRQLLRVLRPAGRHRRSRVHQLPRLPRDGQLAPLPRTPHPPPHPCSSPRHQRGAPTNRLTRIKAAPAPPRPHLVQQTLQLDRAPPHVPAQAARDAPAPPRQTRTTPRAAGLPPRPPPRSRAPRPRRSRHTRAPLRGQTRPHRRAQREGQPTGLFGARAWDSQRMLNRGQRFIRTGMELVMPLIENRLAAWNERCEPG